jgi:hypothetical protein
VAKLPSLEDLDLPEWFLGAAEELKPLRPRWLKALRPIVLRDGHELPPEASAWVLGSIATTEAESARHDLLDLIKRHANPASLDEWIAAMLKTWLAGAAPIKDAWVLTGAGFLGGDATVRALHEAVRQWSKNKDRTLAVRGVDALGRIGSKAALQEVTTLSTGIRDHSVADEAQTLIGSKARIQGASRDEIEDRHVGHCGLDGKGECLLSYGPRTFRVVLGANLELALFGEDGRKRTSLPPPAASDDPVQAEAARSTWAEMKTGVKRVVKSQIKRFEQAMITGRLWSLADFRTHLLGHVIVSRLARALVWQSVGDDPRSTRVTEDQSLAGVNDETIALDDSAQLRVAHPLRLPLPELQAWRRLFTDYRIVQPFQQLEREVHCSDPQRAIEASLTIPEHPPIKSGVLYGILDNAGWRLGRPVDSRFDYCWKSFDADNVTAAIGFSGMIAGSIGRSPDQSITSCTFHSGVMKPEDADLPGPALRLALVPAVAFSETMRRLLRLIDAAGRP